jgi:putative ABC transport system permease protein
VLLIGRTLPFDYAARNLGRSWVRLTMSVLGSTLVVVLMLAAAGFVRGMSTSIRATGSADNVILLGAGSEESIERSEVEASVPSTVEATLSGVRTRAGVGFVSPEVHVQLSVGTPEQPADMRRSVLVRGITPTAVLVHDQVRIVEGRLPRASEAEVMLGRMTPATIGASEQAAAVGRTLLIDGKPWTVVGRFEAPGTVMDAEVWAPLTRLMEATRRQTISCVVLTIDPEHGEIADVDAFAKSRPDLELSAVGEQAYYASLAAFFGPIRLVTWVTAGLVVLGGVLGGLNTMYAAFASRVREVGTLRSLGFRRRAIVLSLVQESTLASAIGALIGAAVGVLVLDGLSVRFSLGAFGLVIDEVVLGVGLAAGAMLGLLGAVPPALRCLRMTIPEALKA